MKTILIPDNNNNNNNKIKIKIECFKNNHEIRYLKIFPILS